MRRSVLLLLGINLVAFGIYFYANMGSFRPIGYYGHFAVYRWYPTPLAVIVSLVAILVGLFVYHLANYPKERDYKIASWIALATLYIPLFITRVLEKSFNIINMQRTPITTDSIWLQYGAARAFLKGLNPYAVDFKKFLLSHADPSALTWIYSGGYGAHNIIGFVTRYDYFPPGCLYYIPPALFNLSPNTWNVVMLAIGIVVLFARMRPLYSPLYAAILSAGMFIFFFEPIRFTPDTGWLVPLMLLVMLPRHPRLSGFLLAWSVLYRPYVGVFALFYLIDLYHENYDWRGILKWTTAFGVVLTLPFLALGPREFINGVLIPFTQNLCPYDTIAPGVITLNHLGLNITPLELKASMILLTVLFAWVSWKYYPRMKFTIFVFPTVIMLFYPRPSYVYYMYYPFVGLIAHVTGFFEGSQPAHHSIRGMIDSFVKELEARKPIIKQHAEFSAHALSLSIISLFLLLEFAYEFLAVRASVTAILIVLPIITYIIATRTNLAKYAVPAIFVLLLLMAAAGLYAVPNVYYILHDYRYFGDYYWLTVYAARDILHGVNPYFQHHLAKLANNPFFGDPLDLVRGSYHIVTPALGSYRFAPGHGYTLYLHNGKWLPIDFYDYPPLLALFTALSIALGLAPGALHVLTFIIAMIVFFLRLKNTLVKTILATLLVAGYVLATLAFSVFSNSVLYTAFLILMIAFVDRPVVSAVFAGLAVMTMPQAGLFILFWLVYLLKIGRGWDYIKRFIVTSAMTAFLVFIPFGYRDPVHVAEKMLFPIIAHLENNQFHGVGIANILTINFGMPLEPFKALALLTFAAALLVAWKREFQMPEIVLLFPVYIFMFFPRTVISYVVFYFLLEALAWVKRNDA